MDLTSLKVKAIIYPYAEYRLGHTALVIDEGAFYRIDGTHIIDKHRIIRMRRVDGRVEIDLIDKTVILEVET